MGYVEKRIKAFRNGEDPTFLEKMALEHGNPVNCLLSLLAFGVFSYGLWTRDLIWVGAAVLIGFAGHLYCWLQE